MPTPKTLTATPKGTQKGEFWCKRLYYYKNSKIENLKLYREESCGGVHV
jgi:hypothetical protein